MCVSNVLILSLRSCKCLKVWFVMPVILECPTRPSNKTGILHFNKVAFKTETRMLRPFAVATS